MERGDVVIVSARGDYGKPRPAVVIQHSRIGRQVSSVTVCFMTSDIQPATRLRIEVEPTPANGLRELSQVQIEKIMTFPKNKVVGPVGKLDEGQMFDIDQSLLIFLDLLKPMQPVQLTK